LVYLIIGLTMFFSMMVPIGPYLLQLAVGGMYGGVFSKFPPIIFLSVNLFFTYLIPLVIALVFIQKSNLQMRVPTPIPGRLLFVTGTILIVLPQFLRLFTSTIPGGGASFALMSIATPFIAVAKVFIFAGAIKLFMSVKPSEEYEYIEN
jgi:hypothetical protein